MEIPSKYDPRSIEDKWYSFWLEKKYFRSLPDDREPYTIVIPPPNVTGVLHMGHMLNNTIHDVLIDDVFIWFTDWFGGFGNDYSFVIMPEGEEYPKDHNIWVCSLDWFLSEKLSLVYQSPD